MMLRGVSLSVLAILAALAVAHTRLSEMAGNGLDAETGGVELAASDEENWAPKPLYALSKPPAGYKYAFGERRHNPNRGERSLEGRAAMRRVWTDDVPQKLIDPSLRNSGLAVTGYSGHSPVAVK